MDTVSYLNPPELHVNPAFTQAVRIPAGHDLVVIGGQNGVDKSGRVVSDDIAGQTRQALHNLHACLRAADASAEHIVRWSLLIKDGASLQEGFGAFMEVWGQQPNPPAITAAMVSGLGVPGALIEIEALAAVPSSDA
jgi:enamine deaminase RidA (YjgF/YER057c/UK114 family)